MVSRGELLRDDSTKKGGNVAILVSENTYDLRVMGKPYYSGVEDI